MNEDDLISRRAAIDELKECRKIYCDNTPESFSLLGHSDKSRVDEIDNSIAILVNLPAVEQKKGKWIKDNGLYKCSTCNDHCMAAGWADCIPEEQMYKVFKFCPSCGASMREEDDQSKYTSH